VDQDLGHGAWPGAGGDVRGSVAVEVGNGGADAAGRARERRERVEQRAVWSEFANVRTAAHIRPDGVVRGAHERGRRPGWVGWKRGLNRGRQTVWGRRDERGEGGGADKTRCDGYALDGAGVAAEDRSRLNLDAAGERPGLRREHFLQCRGRRRSTEQARAAGI